MNYRAIPWWPKWDIPSEWESHYWGLSVKSNRTKITTPKEVMRVIGDAWFHTYSEEQITSFIDAWNDSTVAWNIHKFSNLSDEHILTLIEHWHFLTFTTFLYRRKVKVWKEEKNFLDVYWQEVAELLILNWQQQYLNNTLKFFTWLKYNIAKRLKSWILIQNINCFCPSTKLQVFATFVENGRKKDAMLIKEKVWPIPDELKTEYSKLISQKRNFS